jgi:hypothetical protein
MVGSTQGEPREWLHTPDDAGYHDTPTLDDDVDELYQEEELPPSFVVDPSACCCEVKMKTNKEKSLVA